MCFVLVVAGHVLVQKGFCSEHLVTEATFPLSTMVSVPSRVLDVVPAQIMWIA